MIPKKTSPRLLFVDHEVRGFLQHRIVLARAFREAGFEVHIAVPRESAFEDIARQHFPVHPFYLRRLSARLIDELRCAGSLVRLYRRLRPALAYHIGLKPVLYGGAAARIASVPAVVNMLTGFGHLSAARRGRTHLLHALVAGGLKFSFSHRNQRLILQNPDDRDYLLANDIVSSERTVLIKGSGVNLSSFTPQPEPQGELPVILMVARLLWEKGVSEFAAAARALRKRGIQARFVLLGEPDYGHPSAIPLSVLKRWHEKGDIEWLGWRDDVPGWMARSHIVCLPSYYGEGIPRVLIEAAASGRPIITTDSSGCREIVSHNQNGLLIPARNCEALAEAIARLIGDAPLRAAMGRRGREIASGEFSLERVIEANHNVYRSLLNFLPRPFN